jgi:hypothetical protein
VEVMKMPITIIKVIQVPPVYVHANLKRAMNMFVPALVKVGLIFVAITISI